ncbi:MAG: tetratricopeptide repeat protein [Chitinophagaceae bacterium]|nr:MAG: tetratricopeptide repeat protein [Chitinophagaceae bacterium]
MRRYFFISLLFLAPVLTGLCQTIGSVSNDSLQHRRIPQQNEGKAQLLLSKSKAFWYKNPDSALSFAFQALQFSRDISDSRGVAEAYRYIGLGNMFGGRTQLAESYLDTALKSFENLRDTAGMASTYNNLGKLLSERTGRYDESIFAFEQALFLFQALGNPEGVGSVLNYIGLNYQARGNFQKAIEYLLKGLEVRKKIGDKPGMMFSLARVGDMYQAVGQSETALKYYNNALLYGGENFTEPLLDIYASIARLYMQLKRYDQARKYIDLTLKNGSDWHQLLLARFYFETGLPEKAFFIYEQVMARNQKKSEHALLASSLMGLSQVSELKKDYQAAIKFATTAFRIANEQTIRWIISDAAKTLSFLYSLQGDYHKAYNYEKIYRSIADSLSSADSHIKLDFLESKNEILEKQSSIELLNKENKIKEQQLKKEALVKKVFIAGIIFIVLIAIVLFRNSLLHRNNEQHRRELAENELQIQKLEGEKTKTAFQQQATELEMQALRAQMNPHFIFNCLTSINRFILINKTEEASDYLTKFSRLIRMALINSGKPQITLESELDALRLYLDLERLRFKNAFSYRITFINTIDVNTVYIPPMLIQPFVENAIWHGLMHKKGVGQLEIRVCAEDKMLTCEIVDNGVGRNMAAAFDSRYAKRNKSMGIEITSGRLALLNKTKNAAAVCNIEDLFDEKGEGCGTKVVLTIPYKDLTEVVT